MCEYEFRVGLGKVTPTPMNIGKNDEFVYYVYEYYIKQTGEVFYVGKGRDNRYKDLNRNDIFRRISESYEIDVKKIKTNLTEQQAFNLEEETIKNYLDDGKFLANVQVPIGYRGGYSDDNNYQYMVTPNLVSSKLELYYFHNSDTWDEINEEDLLKTYFWSDCRMREEDSLVYFRNRLEHLPWYANELNKQIGIHLSKLIENKLKKSVRVFKSANSKSAKSIILPVVPTEYKLEKIRQSSKKLFHLVDVLNYLEVDIEQLKSEYKVVENANETIKEFFG